MGATSFENHTYSTSDADAAYEELTHAANFEHGHDPYNGTISTTEGFHVVHKAPMTLGQAYQHMTANIERADKWGPALAVPLLPRDAYTIRVRQLTVKHPAIDACRSGTYWDRLEARRLEAVRESVSLRDGEVIESIRATDQKAQHKDVHSVSKGARETRYFVVGDGGRLPSWEEGHATMSIARAAARARLELLYASFSPEAAVEVVGITRRSGGEALARSVRTRVATHETVKVEVARIRSTDTIGGWFFYGFAAT
ncbi:hypothetical protein GS504_01305 [Rhodococcus hoagii]|nr:hypothetical protein [Prescottella equi]NKS71690.1 hypothetical protein [Prescottella equi]